LAHCVRASIIARCTAGIAAITIGRGAIGTVVGLFKEVTDLVIAVVFFKEKSRSWVFNPHPTKEDCSSYPPWILQDAPDGVESSLCSQANLLSLPKDASLHLRKLAGHP